MVLNPKKTKHMIVNFCSSYKFKTRIEVENSLVDQVNQTKLLGVIISDDMSWNENTRELVKKAYKRMIILRKLQEFKVDRKDLVKIYFQFIRSAVEQSSVVWSSSLTQSDLDSLERIQKVALRIILQNDYISYKNALIVLTLPSMEERYNKLLYNFAIKCVKNPKTSDIFPRNDTSERLRHTEPFSVPMARKERLFKSAVPTMARILNKNT